MGRLAKCCRGYAEKVPATRVKVELDLAKLVFFRSDARLHCLFGVSSTSMLDWVIFPPTMLDYVVIDEQDFGQTWRWLTAEKSLKRGICARNECYGSLNE